MTAYVAGCCCSCGGGTWSCSEDRVKLDLRVVHTITAERDSLIALEKCCDNPTTSNCSPRFGKEIKHEGGTKAELQLVYDAKVRVYLIPPTGNQTGSMELGSWVQDTSGTCTSVWLDSGGTNVGPTIRGTWTSNASISDSFPCGNTADCYRDFGGE